MEDTPLTFVSTVIELSSVIDKLRKEHIVAVDLEVSISLDFFITNLTFIYYIKAHEQRHRVKFITLY